MTETNQKTGNPLLVSAALEQSQDAIEHIDCSDTKQRLTMDFLFSFVSSVFVCFVYFLKYLIYQNAAEFAIVVKELIHVLFPHTLFDPL